MNVTSNLENNTILKIMVVVVKTLWKKFILIRRVYRTKRPCAYVMMFFVAFGIISLYIHTMNDTTHEKAEFNLTKSSMQKDLILSVRESKGTGCTMPVMDPFSVEAMKYHEIRAKVVCPGRDWVQCHLNECFVINEILDSLKDVQCFYRDIINKDDAAYVIRPPTEILGSNKYYLVKSDHVKVSCIGTDPKGFGILRTRWFGYKAGLRHIPLKQPKTKQEGNLNVLIIAFDSTSRNGFIRHMPKSYKMLTIEMDAIVFKSFNVLGDGTTAALFPLMTGMTEWEIPDARKKFSKSSIDEKLLIFHTASDLGYRTVYFEDMPWLGTFQYRFNGFNAQPADHTLNAFLKDETHNGRKWWSGKTGRYCIGDTPLYLLMWNLTSQLFQLDGNKFTFTFNADICHDDFNLLSTADDDFENFLRWTRQEKLNEDTFIIVMGDHGTRFTSYRDTHQGKIEERLPLMAFIVPKKLKSSRPDVVKNLKENVDVLTTAFDIHATLLDILGVGHLSNQYKIPGSDLPRGLTLLKPIPKTRSCGEAGVLPHWCACAHWHNVSRHEPLFKHTAEALGDYINKLTVEHRDKCMLRKIIGVEWVLRLTPNNNMSKTEESSYHTKLFDLDRFKEDQISENYQVKIIMSPGRAVFEGSMRYFPKTNYFAITDRDISRISTYGNESICIASTLPHLSKYCYCRLY